jgi:hypothetical protein
LGESRETVKYRHELYGTWTRVAALARPMSSCTSKLQRGLPTSRNSQLSVSRKKNLVMGPRWVPDTEIGWSTDRRSHHNLNFKPLKC